MKTSVLFAFLCLISMAPSGFKKKQLQYDRVAKAHERIGNDITEMLRNEGVSEGAFRLYIRAFKSEAEIELWVSTGGNHHLMKTYDICEKSGGLGPKRKQGDHQVPEGFYHIDRFNPLSNFHLSLGINYPNRSDKVLSNKSKPGGDIFIHGNCVTVGCLPIKDEPIEELYLLCVEAMDRGQEKIPVTIFPAHMTDENYRELQNSEYHDEEIKRLWSELRSADNLFLKNKRLPNITFHSNGSHSISAGS